MVRPDGGGRGRVQASEVHVAMGEPDWAAFITEGDRSAPGFYFVVGLNGLSRDQTTRIRDQAATALERYETSGRAIVVGAFRGILRATTERLARADVGGTFRPSGPNWYLVSLAVDPTDPVSHVYDDRGTVIAVALANADDPDGLVAAAWRRIASGFDHLRLAPE